MPLVVRFKVIGIAVDCPATTVPTAVISIFFFSPLLRPLEELLKALAKLRVWVRPSFREGLLLKDLFLIELRCIVVVRSSFALR